MRSARPVLDRSESEPRPELELARLIDRARDVAEELISSGFRRDVRRSELRLVGDVIRGNFYAKIPLTAQTEALEERDIHIVGPHGADIVKVGGGRPWD